MPGLFDPIGTSIEVGGFLGPFDLINRVLKETKHVFASREKMDEPGPGGKAIETAKTHTQHFNGTKPDQIGKRLRSALTRSHIRRNY